MVLIIKMKNNTMNFDVLPFEYYERRGILRSEYKDFINMQVAIMQSQLSTSKRMKVGAILLCDGYIISTGYNGTFKGTDNNCEDENFKTINSIVVHAEQNCLSYVPKNDKNSKYTLYCTHIPCEECMKLCILKGVNEIVYASNYRGKSEYVENAKKYIKIRKLDNFEASGIYALYIDYELVYIGSSISVIDRWNNHYYRLDRGVHPNNLLQNYFNKSNKNISMSVIKYCPFEDEKEMRDTELLLIKKYKPCCNQQITDEYKTSIMKGIKEKYEKYGGPMLGKKHTQLAKEKMSKSQKEKHVLKNTKLQKLKENNLL